ncbi:UPF0488 protein C8orf33 [Pimephales promelas]|nr:UPF0488 protein C8orf33 [Pimephales promelas]
MTEESNGTGTPRMLGNEKSTDEEEEKTAADGKDSQQKGIKSTAEETSKQESTELTPDEQLNRELDWCIEQLELGLRTQKTSSKQREEASRALKTLRSSKAPLVKKRQVMRAISGDYRKKIEEERARQFKLIQSSMTSARSPRSLSANQCSTGEPRGTHNPLTKQTNLKRRTPCKGPRRQLNTQRLITAQNLLFSLKHVKSFASTSCWSGGSWDM